MQDIIISLDIGTTVIKAVVFDTRAKEVNLIEVPFFTVSPSEVWIEQDPNVLWNTVIEILCTALKAKKNNQVVQAITIATQGGSVIPVDREGKPVYNIITWMDSRATDLVEDWKKNGTSERIRSIGGWTPQPGLPLPVIAWFKENNPVVFNLAHYWLSINDFIAFKLTGKFATNPSMAGEMLLTDINTGQWNNELCNLAGISPENLSSILPSATIIAGINRESSQITGLTQGTPVVNAGQDHACEALALGFVESDSAFLACGTAWVINGITNNGHVENIPQKMDLNFHVLSNRWITSQFLGSLGKYPEWCLKIFWAQEQNSHSTGNRFGLMDNELNKKENVDEKLIFIPFNGSSNLTSFGNTGGFFGIQFHHNLSDFTYAVLESAGFEVRWALEDLSKNKKSIPELWMIGGASRNPVWPQILADINRMKVCISSYSHGPALGAAILAWLALGVFDSIEDCRKIINLDKHCFHPSEDKIFIYNHKYNSYQRLMKNYNNITAPTYYE